MQKYDLIIIGAGAAGMMAAIVAAKENKSVLLIEKMDQAGRKLRITGKGRCNLTNIAPVKDFLTHVGSNSQFLQNVFSVFYTKELMQFFEDKGVKLVTERGNRVFPQSGKAQDIFMALITTIEKSSIKVLKNSTVDEISTENNEVTGVKLKNSAQFWADNVLLATGGKSYPLTGSTGDGYKLAQKLGHTVTDTFPALAPLITKETFPESAQEFLLKNVKITAWNANQKKIHEALGEMQFMENSLSGALILTLSRKITQALHNGESISVSIDFKPGLDEQTIDKKLIKELGENGKLQFKEMLPIWLPRQLHELALENIDIPARKVVHQLNGEDRKKIRHFLKNFTVQITGTAGFPEAIVTQGGVSLKEINPKTMESKLVKGLYFAGEVMDLDADTGGYNLQIAFSTGFVAGKMIDTVKNG